MNGTTVRGMRKRRDYKGMDRGKVRERKGGKRTEKKKR